MHGQPVWISGQNTGLRPSELWFAVSFERAGRFVDGLQILGGWVAGFELQFANSGHCGGNYTLKNVNSAFYWECAPWGLDCSTSGEP